ncbi:MAG: SDR family oxidoreductase [Nanoarchaeota archaeon]
MSDKKTAIITGAGRGLGKSIAQSLAKEGLIVLICSRTETELIDVRNLIVSAGGECHYFIVDVTDKDAVRNFVRIVLEMHGQIDILVNNAGWSNKEEFLEEISYDDYKKCFSTNIDSIFYIMKEVLPNMKKNKKGLIINMTSGAGKTGRQKLAVYSASKFAIRGLTEAVGRELEGTGVTCISLIPLGGFNTALRAELFGKEDAEKQKSPDLIGEAVKNIVLGKIEVNNGDSVLVKKEGIEIIRD